ncbi:hypothetical protein [Microvirga sp. Mcv34]|uniref:hypothetical protein n=1 Tax=Microvirga sp. Mcv34 TaxID=2926016 RepID=UPI0021CAB1AD|nr:hypothetical protein [Microvirga sp. Mcv34]
MIPNVSDLYLVLSGGFLALAVGWVLAAAFISGEMLRGRRNGYQPQKGGFRPAPPRSGSAVRRIRHG